ncbi:hypothetical protein PR048_006583 [Dryococelus australis]|uniref:Uncharacterized protein n=1 Tax=Dryococelus australis TaxID=614101 RepID=A0ABQ9IBD8_9NEOP|nr:hypothetical protein PR048_006583 [Dryococelus australis]
MGHKQSQCGKKQGEFFACGCKKHREKYNQKSSSSKVKLEWGRQSHKCKPPIRVVPVTSVDISDYQTKNLVICVTFKGNLYYLLMDTGCFKMCRTCLHHDLQLQAWMVRVYKTWENSTEMHIHCFQVLESLYNQCGGNIVLNFLKLKHATISVSKHRLNLRNKLYVVGRPSDESISMKGVCMGVANPSKPTELIQEPVHLKAAEDLPPGTGKRVQLNVVLPVCVNTDVVLVKPVLQNYFLNKNLVMLPKASVMYLMLMVTKWCN